MNQSRVINKIIAADDLHWDDTENKYIALSDDEMNDIIARCLDNAMTGEKEILAVLNWCTSVKVGNLLMKNFISGNIAIEKIDTDGEPVFIEDANGNV
jgi:hypothetical protein